MVEQELIDEVLKVIVTDVQDGDLTALEVLLQSVPRKDLLAFLPFGAPLGPEESP